MFRVSLTERMITSPHLALKRSSSLTNFVVLVFKIDTNGPVLIATLIGNGVPTFAGKPSDA